MVACANIPNLEKNEKISNISNISIKNSSQDFDLTFHSEKWWLVLNDSSLNHLIELVLKNNKSLQIAKLNIKKSEEAINLSKSSKNLDISFRGGLTRVETRENPLKNLTGKDNYSLYNIGLQTSYEFDLFDKFDNSIKEKEYQKIAVDASSKLAELTLEYQTFKLYAYYLYLNEERSNLEDRKALLEKLYSMEKIGVEIGKSLEDNILVVKEMLVGVNILLNKNEENINLVKNNLYLLVGTTSSIEVDNILNNTKNKDFKKLSSKIIIPSSVQSDIIINRPNVQYYLALIEAQDSKIKSLKANFYPSFSITGLLSYKSLKLSDLISPKNLVGIISPSIHLPILDSGRIKSTYKIAGIDYNIFVEEYNNEILNSYKDINEKLIQYNSAKNINIESEKLLKIRDEQLTRSKKRFEIGLGTEKAYITEKYNYLATKLEDSQNNLMLFNTKIDFLNSIGGAYSPKN